MVWVPELALVDKFVFIRADLALDLEEAGFLSVRERRLQHELQGILVSFLLYDPHDSEERHLLLSILIFVKSTFS